MGARNVLRLLTEALKQAENLDMTAGDVLKLLPDADDTGKIQIGNGTKDMDFQVFLGSTSEHALFDVGNSTLALEGVKLTMADGGTVTQASNKTTGVTLSTHSGQITMNNAALGAGDEAVFTVTNTKVAATDVIVVNVADAVTSEDDYLVGIGAVASGSFKIVVSNVTGGSLTDAVVINFAILGGASS